MSERCYFSGCTKFKNYYYYDNVCFFLHKFTYTLLVMTERFVFILQQYVHLF